LSPWCIHSLHHEAQRWKLYGRLHKRPGLFRCWSCILLEQSVQPVLLQYLAVQNSHLKVDDS
jgi:hypothetical protein